MTEVHHRNHDLKPPLISDGFIFNITVALVLFSLVMLYSTTAIISQEHFGDPLFYVKRQAVAALIGVLLLWALSRIDIDKLRLVSPYLLVVCIVLLILPLIPGLGDAAGGAKRWVRLGPIRFQPGEFVKVLFIIFMAGYYSRHEARLKEFISGVVKPIGMAALMGVLLLRQPDFGSTVVIVSITVVMAAVAGMQIRYLAIAGAVLGAAGVALVLISPYRMSRVVTFLTPWEDASGKGYQLVQSLIAVATGKLTGVGLGESQQKLFFLPAAHTDFLFAVIAEELGFIGCLVVLALFLGILWRGVKAAARVSENTYLFTLTIGLTLLIVLPALLNMGVVTGILPTKGMVLPLLGYGGSSLISSLAIVGLLLAAIRKTKEL